MQKDKNEHKKLLTIGKASEYLGVSVDTLRRWEKKGRIEPYRSPGGHRHYDPDDLDKLFDKRYTRDEPTIRSFQKKEASDKNEQEKNTSKEVEKPQLPKITLPAWRAIKEEPEPENKSKTESVDLIKEQVLDRPVREVKIPQATRLQVTRKETMVSPNEAYFRQQTVSILTPPSPLKEKRKIPDETPKIVAPINQSKHTAKNRQNNKALLIYLSVMASIVLFGVAWYFLWKNSQTVLSPIP